MEDLELRRIFRQASAASAKPGAPSGTTGTQSPGAPGGLNDLLKGGLGGLLAGGGAGSVLSGGLNDLLKQFQQNGQGEVAQRLVTEQIEVTIARLDDLLAGGGTAALLDEWRAGRSRSL